MITIMQEEQLAVIPNEWPGHYLCKFAENPQSWYAAAMQIAKSLGLDESIPLKILDLGCGFGYFDNACRELGHDIHSVDVWDTVVNYAVAILGVQCYFPHAIKAHEALPKAWTNYDLVTTFGVNFRCVNGLYWGPNEYEFLASDLRDRLKPGGRWVLRPNQADVLCPRITNLMNTAWWQQVTGPDARISVSQYQVEIQWPNN